MLCPYCRHPLEPLVVQGRATGAWQCIRCGGAWLQYQQIGGLLQAGGRGPVAGLLPAGHLPLGSHSSEAPDYGLQSTRSPWQPLGMAPDYTASPWQSVGGEPYPGGGRATGPTARGGGGAGTRKRSWWPWSREEEAPPQNPDWDLCTYCGQLHPGSGANCAHCNIERMRCPQCQRIMLGVRRFDVLVDMCLSCQGLFFEKGRLEALLERVRSEGEMLEADHQPGPPPSLLQQLAALLEDTEPSPYATSDRPTSVTGQVAAAFSAGLGGGRQILYDFLTMLGDFQSPGAGKSRKPPGSGRR